MENIENIKSTYHRIADEAQQGLNKVQQQIYRIGTLRLLLFVAGVAGLIYFTSGRKVGRYWQESHSSPCCRSSF